MFFYYRVLFAELAVGGIKQAGNIGTALWSFMIAVHLFNLLFLRWKSTSIGLFITLIVGWDAIAVIIFIGAGVIQTSAKGPYFGVSGFWCWITHNYPREQFFLEYFFVSCNICGVRFYHSLQLCRNLCLRALVSSCMLPSCCVSGVTWSR